MSLFRAAIDKRAEEAISLNPAVQTGFIMDTSDVINKLGEDIWFKTFNSMSERDIYTLKQDAVKSGLSIGLKDVNGVNRKERIFCNPKFADLQLVGDGTGKKAVSSGPGMTQADVIYSGTNNQAPTIVGMQFIPRNISDLTTVTKKDLQENSSNTLTGTIGNGQVPPLKVTPEMIVPSKVNDKKTIFHSQSATPLLLDKNGKETRTKDKTQRGVYLNSIRTGTLKLSSVELSMVANATIASLNGII